MSESKWIRFVPMDVAGRKTGTWGVVTKVEGAILGRVFWWGRWRTYAFFPCDNTLFEPTCLRDIAKFIDEQMALRKEARR